MNNKTKWVVRLALAVIVGSACVMFAHANCGNDKDVGNGCSGNTGPQGPAGPQGPQGNPGANGTNGSNGTNGKDGAAGPSSVDPRMTEARLGLDAAVRLYDGRRFQWQLYNIYSPSTHDKEDVFGDGRNLQYGVRLVFKLGSSYEERELEKLRREVRALQRGNR